MLSSQKMLANDTLEIILPCERGGRITWGDCQQGGELPVGNLHNIDVLLEHISQETFGLLTEPC